MIETLTKSQEKLMDTVADDAIAMFFKYRNPNKAVVARWLSVAYGLFDRKPPNRVEIVDSPFAACALASKLTGEKITTTDYCGAADLGWVSRYDYYHRIGVISDEEFAQTKALRDFTGVAWDTILLDECAIVVKKPTTMIVDDVGLLHCANGPCIEWADGNRDFAWHGTWVPERIIMSPRSYTAQEYLAITNTEERRALGESAGWDFIVGLIGAQAVNTWTDPKTGLAYALLRCVNGEQLLRKQSPKLANGDQPTYVEPVHEDLRTAQAARKWQATTLTPRECESDPVLDYDIEA